MTPFSIFSDSSCDLPDNIIKKYNVTIVPFYVSLDHKKYMREIEELAVKTLTDEMVNNGVYPKTSFPPVYDYIRKFEAELKKGSDIICFCLTEKFSGSYQSAHNAANELKEKYPGRRIHIIDSMLATGSQGLLIQQCALMRENGLDVSLILNNIEKIKKTGRVFFTVDSLEYLKHGGRIGKVSALAGQILNIKPVIGLINGELFPLGKARGNKNAVKEILNLTLKEVSHSPDDYVYSFVTSVRFNEIEKIKTHLLEEYNIIIEETDIIGATIGSHIGPTVLGICFIKKYDCV